MESIKKWYSNIGEKLKGLAMWGFIISAGLSIILGFIMIIGGVGLDDLGTVMLGFFWLLFGPVISFLSSWTLYGFGQLIHNSDVSLAIKTQEAANRTQTQLAWKCVNCESTNYASAKFCTKCGYKK